MRRDVKYVLSIVALFFTVALYSAEGPVPKMQRKSMFDAAREAGLSDQELQQVTALEEEFNGKMSQYAEVQKSVHAMMRELRQLESQSPRDEEAIADRRKTLEETARPIVGLHEEYARKIEAILPPEKVQAFKANSPRRGPGGLGRGEGSGPGFGRGKGLPPWQEEGSGPGFGQGEGLPPWIQDLNLSPEQMERVKEIRQKHQGRGEEIRTLREEMEKLRQETEGAPQAADTAQVAEKRERLQAAMKRIREIHGESLNDLESILTPEQQEKLKALRSSRFPEGGGPGPEGLPGAGPNLMARLEKLGLSEEQKAQIQQLLRQMREEIKAIREKYEGQIESFLTEEQKAKFRQLREGAGGAKPLPGEPRGGKEKAKPRQWRQRGQHESAPAKPREQWRGPKEGI